MRTSLKVFLGLSSMFFAAGAVQADPVLVPVPLFPDATSTTVFGIADDNNTITGSYVGQDGLQHGFYGTLDGTYTSFDYPGADSTQPRAIDGTGTRITGMANITSGVHCDFIEWEYDLSSGTMAQITLADGTPLNGTAQGSNKTGLFAADYCDSGGTIHGQLGRNFKHKSDVNTGIASSYTGERGVNRARTAVGFYVDDNTALQLGTIVDSGGTTTIFTYPDANESYTVFEGINDNNHMSGQWGDTGGIVHSFVYNFHTGNLKEIDDPFAASFTQAWGVNNSNLIAVTSDAGPYIWCPKESTCPLSTARAIVLHPREVHATAGKNTNHSTIKHPLPKGTALQ